MLAVAGLQDFFHSAGRDFMAADLHQRAHDVADHVIEEGVGRDADFNERALAGDAELFDRPDRVLGFTAGGTEG